MDIKVRQIIEEDFDVVADLANENLPGWGLNREERKKIFKDHWNAGMDNWGHVMLADDEIVGYLGYIMSNRFINGKEEKICNLTSWFVKEEFRNQSLQLMFPMLGFKKYTITNLTPNKDSFGVLEKFGFKPLETADKLILPTGFNFFSKKYKIVKNHKKVAELLSPEDLKLFNDHQKYDCIHTLIVDKKTKEYCYLISRKFNTKNVGASKMPLPFLHIYYVGNQEMFSKSCNYIRPMLNLKYKVFFCIVGERYLNETKIKHSKTLKRDVPSVYKSKNLERSQVDELYSELFILFSGINREVGIS